MTAKTTAATTTEYQPLYVKLAAGRTPTTGAEFAAFLAAPATNDPKARPLAVRIAQRARSLSYKWQDVHPDYDQDELTQRLTLAILEKWTENRAAVESEPYARLLTAAQWTITDSVKIQAYRNRHILGESLDSTIAQNSTTHDRRETLAERIADDGQTFTAELIANTDLTGALDALPEQTRAAFLLAKLGELTRAQIATRLGMTERAVMSALADAKKTLAARLPEYDHRAAGQPAPQDAAGQPAPQDAAAPAPKTITTRTITRTNQTTGATITITAITTTPSPIPMTQKITGQTCRTTGANSPTCEHLPPLAPAPIKTPAPAPINVDALTTAELCAGCSRRQTCRNMPDHDPMIWHIAATEEDAKDDRRHDAQLDAQLDANARAALVYRHYAKRAAATNGTKKARRRAENARRAAAQN